MNELARDPARCRLMGQLSLTMVEGRTPERWAAEFEMAVANVMAPVPSGLTFSRSRASSASPVSQPIGLVPVSQRRGRAGVVIARVMTLSHWSRRSSSR